MRSWKTAEAARNLTVDADHAYSLATVKIESLTLRVPGDGDVKSLRFLLDRLDEYAVDVEEFSVHTPDLDDVFLALTGHSTTETAK